MTTIAFDGKIMAADTLMVDNWGLKSRMHKIFRGPDYLVGGSGGAGEIVKWWNGISDLWAAEKVIAHGYPTYDAQNDNPNLFIATAKGIWEHSHGAFLPLPGAKFHAAGSGRDYALTAMRLGKSAYEAVELAMEFDNGTGGEIDVEEL